MIGQAAGWFQFKKLYIHSSRDFCTAFLDEYASKEKVEDRKLRLKRTNNDWTKVKSFEKQVYLLIDTFRNIDETMSKKSLVENISSILQSEMKKLICYAI